jgi:hypothetical protein
MRKYEFYIRTEGSREVRISKPESLEEAKLWVCLYSLFNGPALAALKWEN